ncbi:hypothetical protein ABPG74_013665 [Tetrahymena malaccensis]
MSWRKFYIISKFFILIYSQNNIDDQGIQILCSYLEKYLILTSFTLYLDENKIKDQGSNYLGKALLECKSLKRISLQLFENSIYDEGILSLAYNLSLCSNLIDLNLNLSSNFINSEGAKGLGKALSSSQSLTYLKLYLSLNNIGADGSFYLCSSLQNSKSLKFLIIDLSANELGSEGAEHQKPTVTCLIIGGKRCLQYTFPDKTEMVEEYDMKSHELLMRKIKKVSNFKEAKWEYEIGEAPLNPNQQEQLLKATSANPIFLRKDTDRDFQFRIRNLPYPEEVYQIEVDEEKQQLVVRTTNKKYFKRIDVPDMARYNLKLEKGKPTFSYKNSTLLISYPKPDPILLRESERRKQFEKLNAKKPREGDIEFVEN